MGNKKTQYVYLVAEKDATDYVKIGSAKDLNARINNLGCGNHRELVLIDYIEFEYEWITGRHDLPLQIDNEKAIHQQFIHLRYKREWFIYSQEIIEYFKAKNNRVHSWTGKCYRDNLPAEYPTLYGIIKPHNTTNIIFNGDRTKLKNVTVRPPDKASFSFDNKE